ncbi:PAS domain S-box protein [Corallococcus praedator]|uniref:histidine kinase n=1 Tax=Corallococcus praedator TaxID=2316724 RepID=A0ABX9QQ10_9BACT|nr:MULTISPECIES: ATP-binding protein [Corallococcus]RKH33217.1 PAS domain S-box protein [Corallococcus sp. CA031C]RKI13954.1 PAS domain S-box protein [Corallococcus praedator]
MLRRWTFAQRVGAGLSVCLLAGLILLATMVSAAHTLAAGDALSTHRDSDLRTLLVALLGLGCVAALGMVLRNALGPMHAERLQSEQRLHLFMDGVSDYALCFLEPDGKVSCWSTGAERLTGWTSEDIVGQDVELLHVPDAVSRAVPASYRERAARERRLQSEGWRMRKDGSRFWAESLLTALYDDAGRLQGFAEVTRDITERKRTERMQALLAEAGRVLQPQAGAEALGADLTRLCVPEIADACVLYLPGEDGHVRPGAVTCADAATQTRLWEPLLRRPARDEPGPARVVYTGRAERFAEVDPERLPASVNDSTYGELWRALGVRSALSVPLIVDNRVLGALCLLSTRPHRHYGAADQAFLEELSARAALALDNARLLAATQGALELIGVAAHDLGNPLSSLQLRLRRLRLQCAPANAEDPRLREGLLLAEDETKRLGRLVHNLLDLSRLSGGRLELEARTMDLAELAREVVARHEDQATAAGCALTVHARGAACGRWDRQRLDRVLTNLVSNALKFGRGQPVEVRVEHDAHRARLVVRDHGAGIPLEDQQRLFARFERVTTDSRAPGFGLGLYIVRQLVEAHGGTIRVHSCQGEGAEFIVELPFIPESPADVAAAIRA